jgi:hypothetical protein
MREDEGVPSAGIAGDGDARHASQRGEERFRGFEKAECPQARTTVSRISEKGMGSDKAIKSMHDGEF